MKRKRVGMRVAKQEIGQVERVKEKMEDKCDSWHTCAAYVLAIALYSSCSVAQLHTLMAHQSPKNKTKELIVRNTDYHRK